MPPKPDPAFDPDFAGSAQWAAIYRAYGLQIIPCYDPGEVKPGTAWKRPALSEWVPLQEALVSDATFARWYDPQTGEHRNRRNMGILTGRASGNAYIIDLDVHKTQAAMDWWTVIRDVHNNGIALETPVQRTGGGGLQLLLRAPPGFIVPTNRTDIGVDIRGQGGFAVLPSSLHESGEYYEWLPGCAPWEIPILMSPDWLLEEIVRLVGEHPGKGGGGGAAKSNGGASAGDLDAFGHVIDGREEDMRNLIWAALIGLWVKAPMGPPPAPEKEAVWADWVRGYWPKVRLENETVEDGLEREGRGRTLFDQKWAHALKKWDTEIAAEAQVRIARDNAARASSPPPQPDPAKPVSGIPLKSSFPIIKANIPVRDWAVLGLLLKRHLSVLVAPPGSGKSILTLHLSIAIAVGKQWGGWTPRKPQKVLIINAEDDSDEMDRRLVMAAETMGVDQTALTGQVFQPKDTLSNLIIAKLDPYTRSVLRTPLIEEIVKTITENGIEVVVVDPFAETFEVDENNNSQIKWAGVLWREVARRTGCALMLVHHTKKYAQGMAGDPDAARGGGAMTGIARITCTLFNMTEDEAVAMNIPVEDRRKYIRFDDAKGNYHELERAKWFEKRTALVGNAAGFVSEDAVGVLVPWQSPGPFDGFSVHDLNAVLDTIDRGVLVDGQPSGAFFSLTSRGAVNDRWAGKVLTRMLECSTEIAKAILKVWDEKNVVETFEYTDPKQRKERQGVRSILTNRPGKEAYNDMV